MVYFECGWIKKETQIIRAHNQRESLVRSQKAIEWLFFCIAYVDGKWSGKDISLFHNSLLTIFCKEPGRYSSPLCLMKGRLLYYKIPPSVSWTTISAAYGIGSYLKMKAWHITSPTTRVSWLRSSTAQWRWKLFWTMLSQTVCGTAKRKTRESATQVGLRALFKQKHPETFLAHPGQNGPARLWSKTPHVECRAGTIPDDRELHSHLTSACSLCG